MRDYLRSRLSFSYCSYLSLSLPPLCCSFFFFNDTATTEIYTLSLHDALPISRCPAGRLRLPLRFRRLAAHLPARYFLGMAEDRKSTRLNSSHSQISYAVFCLKKKKKNTGILRRNYKA